MKIVVTHSSAFDFKNKLYTPLRSSALNAAHEILLPQEHGKEQVTQDLIKNADVVIAEVSLPSTGQGIELGWAYIFGVPIICLYEKGSKFSNSLHFITDTFIEYKNTNDMLTQLGSALSAQALNTSHLVR
jgi:hypothetical protein